MNKLNVVILSAGLGSRLNHITNYIPKCLVNLGSKTALAHQIEYYQKNYDNLDKIYLIVNGRYKKMVEGYLIANDYTGISVCVENEISGSANAIRNFVNNHAFIGKTFLFNWCDIIPKSKMDLSNNRIIFTHGNQCRYRVDDVKVVFQSNSGNVIGLYYIPYMPNINGMYNNGEDFIKCFSTLSFDVQELELLTDFGEYDKFKQVCSTFNIEREFNEILIDGNTVRKKSINPKGHKLQKDELKWYKYADKNLVPKILAKSEYDKEFIMERIFGTMAFQSKLNKFEIVTKVIAQLDILHNSVPKKQINKEQLKTDITKEAIDKLIHRCSVIDQIVKAFGEIKTVNNLKIRSHLEVANLLYEKILKCNENTKTYSFIHGDCNFSNIMIDEDEKIKFLDPRGYFGNTKLFGLESYDMAKVLYACSGYDEFNSNWDFSINKIENNNIEFDIKPWMNTYLKLDIFSEECYYWLPLIWINLGGYYKNNPVKAIAAYYHGLYLAEIILNKFDNPKTRILKDGSKVPELDNAVKCLVHTKCPNKWTLIDNETGTKYRPTGSPDLHEMWEKIN